MANSRRWIESSRVYKLYDDIKNMKIVYIEAVLMDNGELINEGKSLGYADLARGTKMVFGEVVKFRKTVNIDK